MTEGTACVADDVQTSQTHRADSGYWALLSAWCLYLFACRLCYLRVVHATGGPYVYPLDDIYIHMAMAKHLVQNGVFGITPYAFSSSSSAPAWTLLMALCFAIFGVRDLIPFIMAAVAGLILIAALDFGLRPYWRNSVVRLLLVSVVCVAMPLPLLTSSGMEHVLHAALEVIVTLLAAASLAKDRYSWRDRQNWLLLFAVAVCTFVRMETIFLSAGIVLFALLRKRVSFVVALVAASALPWLVLGIVSVSHGWRWVPNSIGLKTPMQDFDLRTVAGWVNLSDRWLTALFYSPYLHLCCLFFALAAAILIRLRTRDIWERSELLLALIAFCILARAECALLFDGWIQYRYIADVTALALFGVFVAAGSVQVSLAPWRRNLASAVAGSAMSFCVLLLLFFLPGRRAYEGWTHVVSDSVDTHKQQFQMARFLKRFYEGTSVAANDVGAINYYADIDCVDLAGLGNIFIAKQRSSHKLSTEDIALETARHRTRIAIVYDNWFGNSGWYPALPSSWVRVGRWQVSPSLLLGGDTVSFYAVDPKQANALREHLAQFSTSLPGSVRELGP